MQFLVDQHTDFTEQADLNPSITNVCNANQLTGFYMMWNIGR